MPEPTENRPDVRPEIRSVLNQLRSRIRRYVALEGLALVAIVVAVAFWLSLGLDTAWFELTRLELPRPLRMLLAVVAVCVVVFVFLSWVVSRMQGRFDDKNLALVLERRFPELNDRLITAVEAPHDPSLTQTSLSSAMLDRTIEDVSGLSRQLDVSSVFEKRPLHRAGIWAVVLLASIAAFSAVNAKAMNRWFSAFVKQDDNYWERNTRLNVRVIASPNDRIREFEQSGRRFVYRHPRGADLALLIDVPNDDERDWEVPDRVRLDIYQTDNSRSRVFLSPTADGEFRYTINQLQDNVSLYIRGGDFTNTLPYVVTVVDPPRVDRVRLNCDYPKYTGLNERGEREVIFQDAQTSLPYWTKFEMQVDTNKPLTNIRVQTDAWQFESDAETSKLTFLDDANPDAPAKTIDGDSALSDSGFLLPIFLAPDALEREPDVVSNGPIPLAPDTVLRVYIEDEHGIMNSDPVRLTVTGQPDEPPVVTTRRRGIGDVITRKARIPISGLISDDYGIQRAHFDFKVDDDEDWRLRSFRTRPNAVPQEFVLQRSDEEEFEAFDVLPLDLEVGQKLVLSIYAEDADNLSGPHKTHGQEFAFRIVSNEELLSLLYAREVNLRRRFEQIISEVKRARSELQAVRDRGDSSAAADDDASALGQTPNSVAVRTQASLRKNATETLAIEDAFQEILEELVNNAVHTRQMMTRMDELIISKLAEINTRDFPGVDLRIGEFRLAAERKADFQQPVSRCITEIDTMLRHMEQVLEEIQDLAEFHEALRDLQAIIDAQKELSEKTRQKQIEKLKQLLD